MGTFKMLIGLFVILGGIFIGIKVVPAYFENYEFRDWIKDEATRDTYAQKTENDIRTAVFRKAQDLDIPITEEGIKVQRQGMQFAGVVIIQAPYVVHVDIPGYPFDMHFDASTENKSVF